MFAFLESLNIDIMRREFSQCKPAAASQAGTVFFE